MLRSKLLIGLLCAGLAGCSTHQARPVPPAPQVAGQVTIWRGVNVLPGTTNIDWSNASFGVSGQPVPTLSFFDAQGAGRACWLAVTVDAPVVPVPVGQGGNVTLTIPPAPAGIGASPWAAVFDNNPAGHWSIAKPTITGGAAVSNAVAGTMAGATFRASAAAGQVVIADGTVQGCQL
jgi:hypothetical protein